MNIKFSLLLTDYLLFSLIVLTIILLWRACQKRQWREAWKQVISNPLGMTTLVILIAYTSVALLDSIHFQQALSLTEQGQRYYGVQSTSVLDVLLGDLASMHEKSYSAPLAIHSYTKQVILAADGKQTYQYEPLQYVSNTFSENNIFHAKDLFQRVFSSIGLAITIFCMLSLLLISILSVYHRQPLKKVLMCLIHGNSIIAWRSFLLTSFFIVFFICLLTILAQNYHVFGTDKIGNDILYITLKSIRTGLLIGSLTTLIMLPFALLLGTMAGYFGGWIDDIIQYIYTTLSSIPGVLLVAAAVLSLQVYISNHADLFTTLDSRADMRLIALCAILGVTSWTSLCRVLRAETLKIRELEYIQAAHALGTQWFKIINKHILPNVMHIIVITIVLDFSALVLAEAVLSYVGIGVDPITYSWGNMINSARLELARDPVVWWPLFSAFIFMFVFVLAANLFADVVNEAFDPRHS